MKITQVPFRRVSAGILMGLMMFCMAAVACVNDSATTLKTTDTSTLQADRIASTSPLPATVPTVRASSRQEHANFDGSPHIDAKASPSLNGYAYSHADSNAGVDINDTSQFNGCSSAHANSGVRGDGVQDFDPRAHCNAPTQQIFP